MKVKITVLGAGGAFADMTRGNSSFLIDIPGRRILVDCGTTVPYVLRDEMGIPLTSVTDVVITHCHADHAGGLEMLMLSHRWMNGSKPILWAETQVMENLQQMVSHLKHEHGGEISETGLHKHAYMEPLSSATRARIGELHMQLIPVSHVGRMPATSVLFEKLLFISGDTRHVVLHKGRAPACQLIFHEGHWLRDDVHVHVDDLAASLNQPDYRGKRVYVYHCPAPDPVLRPLPQVISGILSKGDTFELPYP